MAATAPVTSQPTTLKKTKSEVSTSSSVATKSADTKVKFKPGLIETPPVKEEAIKEDPAKNMAKEVSETKKTDTKTSDNSKKVVATKAEVFKAMSGMAEKTVE